MKPVKNHAHISAAVMVYDEDGLTSIYLIGELTSDISQMYLFEMVHPTSDLEANQLLLDFLNTYDRVTDIIDPDLVKLLFFENGGLQERIKMTDILVYELDRVCFKGTEISERIRKALGAPEVLLAPIPIDTPSMN